MPSLPELQRDLVASLSGRVSPALLAMVEPDGLDPADRLQVYANHFRLSLVEALGATFPVVRRLLGEDCFGQVARRFARTWPPRSPRLVARGGCFPSFLATQPQLAGLPWLRDVARLEWALNEARHADDPPPAGRLEPDMLGDPTRLAFATAPCVRFVASRWPVDQIWRANQGDDRGEPVALEARGARLLVLRDADDEVGWLPLPHAAFVFTRAIAAGHSLSVAADMAMAADATFAPVPLLQALLAHGVVVDAVVLASPERMPS